jgi:ribosome-binding protein aMBF1 (putative translation factor)
MKVPKKIKNVSDGKSYFSSKLKDQTIKSFYDEEKAKSQIAKMIRTAREKAGLSQRELASKAGTTQAVVSRIESGNDTRMPSLTLIYRLLLASNAKLELKCVFDKAA